jgi:prolyl-tRNA synthetase
MPSLIPEEVYIASKRRDVFGDSMFTMKDRFNRSFVLGPTHEELFATAASSHIRSYKDLPISLYQFQNKFRDEPRPRFGLIRVREFIMKDAYTFDKNIDGLDRSYQQMFSAYKNAFDRMGLHYRIVKADTGVMGGLLSEEFQAITDIGEDHIVYCDQCDYAANVEIAEARFTSQSPSANQGKYQKVDTPHQKTIQQVSEYLNRSANDFVKTLVYQADDQLVAVSVVGEDEVSTTKLAKYLSANHVELADAGIVLEVTKTEIGFLGPIGCPIRLLVDQKVENMHDFVVGANQKDTHFIDANILDFAGYERGDFALVKADDPCFCGHGSLKIQRGIEVGNTFKLGEKYARAMDLFFNDENNQLQPVIMGSYGIGLGRCMAAIVEQNHQNNKILWPVNVAPYEVAIVTTNQKVEKQQQLGDDLYQRAKLADLDVLWDDRDERAGIKFNDMELIGIPFMIVIGKAIEDKQVEIKDLLNQTSTKVMIDDVVPWLQRLINDRKKSNT